MSRRERRLVHRAVAGLAGALGRSGRHADLQLQPLHRTSIYRIAVGLGLFLVFCVTRTEIVVVDVWTADQFDP